MKSMNLMNQALLVNLAIFAALVYEYFRGAPILAIAVTGIALVLMVNVIFFVRARRAKKAQ